MSYTIKFWNENRWNVFDEFGACMRSDVDRIARKLALLFSAVEIHTTMHDGSLEIERVA